MMKLSKAQQIIIDDAKKEIDFARTHTLIEWAKKYCGRTPTYEIKWYVEKYGVENAKKDYEKIVNDYAEQYEKYYENEKNAIVLCNANSRTIKKLEEYGLIEIINDGRSYIDTIKLLNY